MMLQLVMFLWFDYREMRLATTTTTTGACIFYTRIYRTIQFTENRKQMVGHNQLCCTNTTLQASPWNSHVPIGFHLIPLTWDPASLPTLDEMNETEIESDGMLHLLCIAVRAKEKQENGGILTTLLSLFDSRIPRVSPRKPFCQ